MASSKGSGLLWLAQHCEGLLAAVGQGAAHLPHAGVVIEDFAVGGVVVDDEHVQAAEVLVRDRLERDGLLFEFGLKEKMEPLPSSLVTPISPFIISTRRLEMARPRPVPPYLRVVEPSAWLKALKRRLLAFFVDADAGVADLEARGRRGSAFR